jgi:nitrate reductase gamma subunit
MNTLQHVLFGYYPYLCLIVLVVGSIYRFEREQYTWQASSSQMLRTNRSFNLASNLFHLGILGLVGGHVAGLLVPASVYHFLGVTDAQHQWTEIIMGGATGTMTLIGLTMLLLRRLTDERIRQTSSAADLMIAVLLWVTLVIGMATLPFSYETRNSGEYLHALSGWAQAIVTLQSGAAERIVGVPWMFKAHVLLGLTVMLVFPFTRLVHVCSAPIGYMLRRHSQIVRAKRTSNGGLRA